MSKYAMPPAHIYPLFSPCTSIAWRGIGGITLPGGKTDTTPVPLENVLLASCPRKEKKIVWGREGPFYIRKLADIIQGNMPDTVAKAAKINSRH